MSQKQVKSIKKHTVKEVLASIQWSIEKNKLILLSPITDEYVTIELLAILAKENDTTQ